jgi:intracellular sulfur oxidation DsrE/DsrF family protein
VTERSSARAPRRRFLTQLGAAVAAVTGGAVIVGAQGTGHTHPRGERQRMQHTSPHDAWMEEMKGHHRQFFHATEPVVTPPRSAIAVPMLMAKNYLDAYTGPYAMRPEHVNAVIGVHGPALGIVLNDEAWTKFALGQRAGVTDPATQQPSSRNIFATGPDTSVAALQARGVKFLVCETALRIAGGLWAPSVSQTGEATFAELKASLLPGVVPVPAMVVTLNRAQEAGFTYVRAS